MSGSYAKNTVNILTMGNYVGGEAISSQCNESKSSRWSPASHTATVTDTVSCCLYTFFTSTHVGQTPGKKKLTPSWESLMTKTLWIFLIQSHTAHTAEHLHSRHSYLWFIIIMFLHYICFLHPMNNCEVQPRTCHINFIQHPLQSRI